MPCPSGKSGPVGQAGRAPGAWGEIFRGDTVVAALIDQLVHHPEIISLKGSSYRLRGKASKSEAS